MRSKVLNTAAVASLLLATGLAVAQQQVNLTAGPTGITLPDGNAVPMWGYTCGALVANSSAKCAPLSGAGSEAAIGALGAVAVINPGSGYTSAPGVTITGGGGSGASAVAAIANGQVVSISLTAPGSGYTSAPSVALSGGGGSGAAATAGPAWSPVVITVPTGATGGLQINLTNNLSFTPSGSTTANSIPTSVMIVGQVGGGLGSGGNYIASPNHDNAQSTVTWPIAGGSSTALPPTQGPRVQSFGTEVAAAGTTPTGNEVPSGSPLVWPPAKPGLTLKPGTYLLESGTHPSIQVPMGLIGMLVVTCAPGSTACPTTGTAYPAVGTTPAVNYNAEIPLELSEIDPVQNNSVNIAVNTAGFNETMVWSNQGSTVSPGPPGNGTPGCGNPTSPTYHQCYPPAVNYTPFYYLINGVAFDKASTTLSNFPVSPATGVSGTVLVRLVNAGLKMHVPSIVGSQTSGWNGAGTAATVNGFTLIAEDGNPVPGPLVSGGTTMPAPRVQTDVFMAAGKTFDVMINAPTSTTAPALPIYDRQMSLSANSSVRDAGMLAYISVNGAALPAFAGAATAGAGAGSFTPVVMPDTYNSVVPCASAPCASVVVSSVAKGVTANDSFVNGVQLASGPSNGTLTCSATPGNPVAGLCANGTFTYTPNVGFSSDSFMYCANGATLTSNPSLCTTVTLGTAKADTVALVMNPITYTAPAAGYIKIAPPGPLSVDKDPSGFPLSVVTSPAPTATGCTTLAIQPNGGFIATGNPTIASSCTFTYTATNGQADGTGNPVTGTATVTINFPAPNAPTVAVLDGQAYKACAGDATCINGLIASTDPTKHITDYRWLIEEDKTFYVNPACTTNSGTAIAGCITPSGTTVPPTFGVNFHTSHMEQIAQGCTGGASSTDFSCEEGQSVLSTPSVCEVGNGVCVPGTQQAPLLPTQVALDPGCGFGGVTCTNGAAPYPKRYYITVFPGDAATPFNTANLTPGHGMGGAPISWNTATNSWNPVIVLAEPNPYPPGKLSVMVFEDDFPLNGEQDAGGGIDVIATNEPGLGGFEIILWDAYGQLGDVTGQMTHDMFNQPLSNSLAGTIDPATGKDACPIAQNALIGGSGTTDPTATGISGRIVTCPKYESDGKTLSPLAGQAVIANLMPGKFNVQAVPGADRIARGEEWLQTNTLDGQHQMDSFIRIGEPSYFQEYGPAGYHVTIGFANPALINARHAGVCAGTDPNLTASNCTNTVKGKVTAARMSRPPDERLYSSQSRDAFYWTQCFVSLGDPDGEDFMFTKCDADGNFNFTQVPSGSWRLSIFDQWNDQLMDGLSTPVNVANGGGRTVNMGDVAVQQWQANVYTRTFIDDNKDGLYQSSEIGIPFLNLTVRYRDGSRANWLTTDFTGVANFNETFPLFNWYVVETDVTRYKTTGIHTVYDAGGPPNGSTNPLCGGAYPACESKTPYDFLANTKDPYPLPADLSVPGAIYCTSATCSGYSIFGTGTPTPGHGAGLPSTGDPGTSSTGRIDPPWVVAEGWQGFSGQNNFIEFGKTPYANGENGGIQGHVVYASTRPFDDPAMNVQQPWEPLVPRVTINLYQEGFAADGVTPTLALVDTIQTSSWDDWAQGFYPNYTDSTTGTAKPYMNCPGQAPAPTSTTPGDLFFYTLYNQPNYLDAYNAYYSSNGSQTQHALPYNSQYKCYDAMHNWNQLQPAPYDGMYAFPSVLGIVPNGANAGTEAMSVAPVSGWHQLINGGTASGNYFATNCTVCIPNPDTSDPWRVGTPMLPPGKYVVEVVMPPGYELVKEEDKNILIGDNFIAPVTQEFGGLGNIFIIPDQASVASLYDPSGAGYNASNVQNATQALGAAPNNQIVPGFIPEPVWPCVGQARIVPDYMSIFPQSGEVAPFAGATRNLCDRKEVTLTNQMAAIAKFYVYTTTHIASKYAGVITDDFTSEFDPFAPVFGEKFSPPNMPVSMRDWTGNETSRVYSDQWGAYNGLTYSSWEVNPPNPTGYSPTMMVSCMNDKGPAIDFRPTIVDSSGTANPNPNFGKMVATDPLFNPLYSQFCYELPYMPGATDYQDTPVVPTAGLVGAGYNNPDCAYPTLTPAIASVVNSDSSLPQGPWVRPATVAARAHVTFSVSGVAQCTTTPCTNPSSITFPGGLVKCTANGTGGPNCSSSSPTTRNDNVATYIRSNVGTLMGSGYTASGLGTSVTVTAPATGSSYNGTIVVSAAVNVFSPTPPSVLAGGADAVTASMGLTITALGDQAVGNYGYAGPQSATAPFNQKTVTRHYGFGPTPSSAPAPLPLNCTPNQPCVALVGSDGVSHPLTNVTWGDSTITGTVPSGLPACAVQQQAQYNGGATSCGELVITTAAGQQSIDTVTVTIGGKQPTVLTAGAAGGGQCGPTIQACIDAAAPGDMIIVPPGTYRELVLMWKPVRLQGVGAASSVIDASTHPAGTLKLDPWRASVNCLFGLTLAGQPSNGGNFDPTGTYMCPTPSLTGTGTGPDGNPWAYFYGGPNVFAGGLTQSRMVVDRIPLEGILGWDATVNGNLAEQLQEPSIMGAYEGAAITVLSKGVNIPAGSTDVFGSGTEAAFPTGTTLLTGTLPTTVTAATGAYIQGTGDNNPICRTSQSNATNPFPSNFMCNPSSIDGLGLTDASQGGGGIFVHAWAHNLQIANNRIYNNAGTLSGGISLGQGESPEAYLAPNSTVVTATAPGSCADSFVTNLQLPYCQQLNVNIHHNMVVDNSSTGDELFSGTPAGAGGVSICTGSDYYKFNYNWVCGNMSTGDGGGVGHLGFSYNGDIEHNSFLFNQATNPSIQANGGGLMVMGAAPDGTINGTECGSVTDNDCVPGLSDGTGPGLVINANLFEGNSADAGSGGGLRLQAVNGTDISRFPSPGTCSSQYGSNFFNPFNCLWYVVSITNNIIDNNVAGWDGAGISLEDALVVKITNNTISSNDTTASSGVLFNTLGAPLASSQSPGPTCQSQSGGTVSCPQPAGLVTMQNSPQLTSSFTTGAITCPQGTYAPGTSPNNGTCTHISYPGLYNNLFWQNRSFQVGVGSAASGVQNQQNIVTLYNAAFGGGLGTVAASQSATGMCPSGSSYWDIGVRNDTGPNNHSSGYTLNPLNGVLSSGTGYSVTNSSSDPAFASQYCNGSRVPPEAACQDANGKRIPCGWQVPPGIADAVVPNPVFSLTPAATVDEGNNWINISWGPLSMLNPMSSNGTTNVPLGNYALKSFSPAINAIPCSSTTGGVCTVSLGAGGQSGVTSIAAPATDFFGNRRPDSASPTNRIDVGAVESQSATTTEGAPTLASISPVTGGQGTTLVVTLTGTNLNDVSAVTVSPNTGITVTGVTVLSSTQVEATFSITTTAPLTARSVTVTTPGGTSTTTAQTFTVVALGPPTLTSISPTSGQRGTTVPVVLTGTNFTSGSTVAVSAGSGITVANPPTVVSTTQIETTFSIATNATLASPTVTVTTSGPPSNSVPFTVVALQSPTLTSITPISGNRGTSVNVTLTGSNFASGATVTVSGTRVTVSNVKVVDSSQITATFAIANNAAATDRTVSVTTTAGTTTPLTFTVN